MTKWGRALGSALLATLAFLPVRASATNDQGYFLDPDSSMSAGAVVATTESVGSLWYNPAGLAGVDRPHVNVSVTVGMAQFRQYENAIVTLEPGGHVSRNTLNGRRLGITSPGVGYVRRFGRVNVAFGLFSTRDESLRVTGASSFDDGAGRSSRQQTTLDDITLRTHLGLGLGVRPHRKLRLGGSMFLVYESVDQQASVTIGADDTSVMPSSTVAFTTASRDESARIGGQATFGLQYTPIARLALGLHVRSPIVNFTETLDASTILQYAITGSDAQGQPVAIAANDFDRRPRRAAGFGMLAPPKIVFGLAYRWRNGHLAIEADFSPAVRSLDVASPDATEKEYLLDVRSLWNVRVGTIVRLTDSLEIGAGLYTDRSDARPPDDLGRVRVHYYGVTSGIRFANELRTTDGTTEGRIVFASTIAARYALGIGHAAALEFDLSSPQSFGVDRGPTADVVFHEVHLYVGSSLSY